MNYVHFHIHFWHSFRLGFTKTCDRAGVSRRDGARRRACLLARRGQPAEPDGGAAGGILHVERADVPRTLGAARNDGLLALARPVFYATNRVFATRLLHTVLRGESRDRLDLLGEEFFQYFLKPRLKPAGVERLKELLAAESDVVLVSQGLDHIMRPLATHLGVERILSNRLDFRDGLATGRLLDPVIRPRGLLAKSASRRPDGTVARAQLVRDLGFTKTSRGARRGHSPGRADAAEDHAAGGAISTRGRRGRRFRCANRCEESRFC